MNNPRPKYLNLRATMDPWKGLKWNIKRKAPDLQRVSAAYENNLQRVYLLAVFPAVVVNSTASITRVATKTHLELFGTAPDMLSLRIDPKIADAINADADARDAFIKAGGQPARDLMQRELDFGFAVLNQSFVGDLQKGAHAWLSAQVTGSWTAFEAMAEELWTAALNIHPAGLAELKGALKGQGEDKKVDLSMLQRYGYDLSKKMGLVLRKRYAFDKLDEIRLAYSEASFSNDAKIAAILADHALDALAATRHAIVHNGGLVDEGFLKKKKHLPPAMWAELDESIPLDGDTAAALIGPVLQLGANLIGAVDDWLEANQ